MKHAFAFGFFLLSSAHLLLSGVSATDYGSQDGGETEFQLLLSTKRTCNSAAFYDCCQVRCNVPRQITFDNRPVLCISDSFVNAVKNFINLRPSTLFLRRLETH